MKYSTDVPNDPDTHEDFRPTSKVDASGLSLKEVVEQVQMSCQSSTLFYDGNFELHVSLCFH